jgi:hypothetical protein
MYHKYHMFLMYPMFLMYQTAEAPRGLHFLFCGNPYTFAPMKKERKFRWVAWFERPVCFYTKREMVEYCKGKTVIMSRIRYGGYKL